MEIFNYLLIPTAPHQAANKQAQTLPRLDVSHILGVKKTVGAIRTWDDVAFLIKR